MFIINLKLTLNITRFILLTALTSCGLVAISQPIQRYNNFKYSVNEGLLQSTMSDINFDSNNFCWLSFPNGIQKFDGKNFINIPVQPGLPDNKWCYFFRCKNGDLLISHIMGISKYEISNNKFIHIYKNPVAVLRAMKFIGEDEGTIYGITEEKIILGLSADTYKVVCEVATGIRKTTGNKSKATTIVGQNIINHQVVIMIDSSLCLFNLQKRKLQFAPVYIPDILNYFFWLENEEEVFYYKYGKDYEPIPQHYNFVTKSIRKSIINDVGSVTSFRSATHKWQDKTLLSYFNHLYETSPGLDSIKYELVDFHNKPIGGNSAIVKIAEDHTGNLYLQTINDGFRKIIRNAYPIKYYGTGKIDGNYIISLLQDKKNNRVLAGTYGNGILIFDSLQRLIKHIPLLPGNEKVSSVNCIIKKPDNDYILSSFGDKMWLLDKDLNAIKTLPVTSHRSDKKPDIGYFINPVFQDKEQAIIKSERNLYRILFNTNEVHEYSILFGGSMGGTIFNGHFVTHINEDFVLFDTATFREIKKYSLKGTGDVRCFLPVSADSMYVGSNKGIYLVDRNFNVLQRLQKEDGLPDECIYAMAIDNQKNLWCSTNKGIIKVRKDYRILHLTKEDGLQENEFNTNITSTAEDGEIFFGGVNGVSSFFPGSVTGMAENINVLFTDIRINNEDIFQDTAVWNIDDINLRYDQNSLSFNFIAIANNHPDRYIYQYKMKGVDKEWIQNDELQTVHYYLQPGQYEFDIYASRVFNKNAKPMRSIKIWIHPPFWKTWWFITAISLLAASLLAFSINRYNRRKYQKKLLVLEGEHKVKLERERISRDLHDSIGAYANAILYNTELLQKEPDKNERTELMNDLKFASKDIITALRETIWALKKDNYTAEECLLRIRNFIQPFTRYYPQIQFNLEGNASAEKILNYSKALNLVRIVQEAVTNSLKHANPTKIDIVSVTTEDSWQLIITDNGKGFDPQSLKETEQGNGLGNMKQRALDAGFNLEIGSGKRTGTSIVVKI